MSVTGAIDVDTTTTPCLAAEVLATFAEGRLAGEERARVLAHLAGCADCREVLAETVAFLDEDGWEEDETAAATEGKVVPGPWQRLMPGLGTLAAMLVVGIGVVAFWSDLTGLIGDDPVDRVQLASRLDWAEVPDDAPGPVFGGTVRGDGDGERPIEPEALVRIGAALLDLEVAARAGEEPWGDRRDALRREFVQLEFAQAWVLSVEALEPDGLTDLEDRLREWVDDDAVFVDLGLWAEAGRLATLAGDLETLRSEEMVEFVPTARRSNLLRTDLPSEARSALETVVDVLTRGASDEDLGPLQKQFEDVLFHSGQKKPSPA